MLLGTSGLKVFDLHMPHLGHEFDAVRPKILR